MQPTDVAELAALEQENLSPWSMASLVHELTIEGGVRYVAEGPGGRLDGWCACRVLQPEAELLKVVQAHTEQRTLGLLGEPRVNVLRLNLALDALKTGKE